MAQLQQVRSAGQGTDLASGGIAWTSPGYITASDNNRALVLLAVGQSSDALVFDNFGFTIPSQSDIVGVSVLIERSSTENYTGYTEQVKIWKSISNQSTAKGPGSGYTIAEANETWGSSSDLWGYTATTLKVADVNNATFGGFLTCHSLNQIDYYMIDYVQMTVTYQPLNRALMIV